MPQRRQQSSRSATSTSTTSSREDANDLESIHPQVDPSRGTGAAPGSLKEFVKQYKDKHYHAIEMRITLVCSFGIFLKLFFSDVFTDRNDSSLTYSALIFIGLCIIVIIFNTWLDYYPSRLVEVQLRESRSQGLPMACLFLPMFCCAHLYFSLHWSKEITALLLIYLVILCLLSLCSILATLLHSIPHPNHIVFYNFVVVALTFALQATLKVSMWFTVPAVAAYSMLGVWFLHCFPRTFTLGEALIVAQSLTMLLLDTTLQLLTLHGFVSLPKSLQFLRGESVLFVELLVLGVVLCCLLLSPALYKLSCAQHYHEKKFWSGTFILLSLSVGFMLVLPWLGQLLGGHHPLPFIFLSAISYPGRLALIVFWLVVSVVTGVVVYAQSSTSSWAAAIRSNKSGTLWVRKIFHLSGVIVYLSGIALDPNFTALVSAVVVFFFIVIELCRVICIWPCGEVLQKLFLPFMDRRDSGFAIVSNLYLLLGFCVPLWLSPLRSYNQVSKLAMYSGVLALGVGDAVASIAGSCYGNIKWPGTKKTVEGSLASVLAQLLTIILIIIIDPHLDFLSGRQWALMSGCVVITAAMEAYTWQIDNLILGLLQHALTIAFLN